MKTIGSQKRETLEEAGYEIVNLGPVSAILRDKESEKLELFFKNDHASGWVVEIDGVGYEFVTSNVSEELIQTVVSK